MRANQHMMKIALCIYTFCSCAVLSDKSSQFIRKGNFFKCHISHYITIEYADINLSHGAIRKIVWTAEKMFAERDFIWREPQNEMFARVHLQLCETGSVISMCHDREDTYRRQRIGTENSNLESYFTAFCIYLRNSSIIFLYCTAN